MKPKGIDNERINNLIYLYGQTSLYPDLIGNIDSKNNLKSRYNISYISHIGQDKSSLIDFAKRKSGYTFKIPELNDLRIKYQKKVISGYKAKIELHSFSDDLFYVHMACSDLSDKEKNHLANQYASKYLEEKTPFNFEENNIIDAEGRIISFCNTFNYSSNDFSVDFILDRTKFSVK